MKNKNESKSQILLTNDDGIRSPGLFAAAEALSKIGFVTVVAPRDQSSSTGRSMPIQSDGIIKSKPVDVLGEAWTVYAVGGTPAQAVQHGVLEVSSRKPDLVVSGINYGENVGTGVTISGTVGAALEAAALDIPAIAISLETDVHKHYSYSDEVDFSVAAHFTRLFGKILLEKRLPDDVHVLKIDVPCDATEKTPWEVTRISRQRYYRPDPPSRKNWDEPYRVGYSLNPDLESFAPDSDVYALCVKRVVSVTPLSLDITSRIQLDELGHYLR